MATKNIDPQYQLLIRFMYLSVAAALVTMALKAGAAWVTGSVGFLSDALESGVNLVAAVVAIIALSIAGRPADENHHFGHGKAEYFSALVEGAMILVAAVSIIWSSVNRLLNPQPLESVGVGLLLSVLAGLVNLAVGVFLIRQGRAHRSITLEADGRHLMTDVWTTAGVLVGIVLVWLTGWSWLDAAIALSVGVNILFTGWHLLRDSSTGLLSQAMPPEDIDRLEAITGELTAEISARVTDTRTVASGRHRHIFLTVEAPADISLLQAHNLTDALEMAVEAEFTDADVFIHVEPQD
ncbi:cation diffusion facilitator family transporter [Corynebacterium guangdongense]|uniref:Cation diffusion facilitator family transporter n=1 Tax=Corynebacterium guangdongense TaxID=1783348 RepID=A0ABU1ZZ95_9CORY|nr:cation diffusion facilitator family transporter [Corynebacterium guangdongense]MDR7330263.1 cation diffusion facilitator family transporter [Corynebacterium guangdongense]WJZ18821.1 Ferrous-iron efflux pump FieF [Corynebacterium guangdongense]